MSRFTLSIVERIIPRSADYDGRKQLVAAVEKCISSGCPRPAAGDALLCDPCGDDHRKRQNRSKAVLKRFRKAQLWLGLPFTR